MQARSLFVLLAVSAAGCHSARAPLPGASFARSSVLAPLSAMQEAHDDLLSADIGRADSVARLGYSAGLASMFASDVTYLRGGLPIVRGRPAALAIARAESLGTAISLRWQPVRAEPSRDGRSGFTYGYTITSIGDRAGSPALHVDRYIAFWRREPVGWRISAYAETYGSPPAPLALPDAAVASVLPDVAMPRSRGPLDALRDADNAFSTYATEVGTGEAFGRYAADDAQIFSASGEFITGPTAIMESFGPSTSASSLEWRPVFGEISGSGDLGFTVGNAVFTGRREGAAPIVRPSKYLTVWKRQRVGGWRYVVDGGSARPGEPIRP